MDCRSRDVSERRWGNYREICGEHEHDQSDIFACRAIHATSIDDATYSPRIFTTKVTNAVSIP